MVVVAVSCGAAVRAYMCTATQLLVIHGSWRRVHACSHIPSHVLQCNRTEAVIT